MLKKTMSRIGFLTFILAFVFLCTGCLAGTEASASGVKHCSRQAEVEGATMLMSYDIYYEGDYVTIIKSLEGITSDDQSLLDTYEEAWKKIYSQYEGIDYYDNQVIRDDNSVICDTEINYVKTDISKIIEIEGEEDNIFENGKVKLSTWLNFAKKLGVTCGDEEAS